MPQIPVFENEMGWTAPEGPTMDVQEAGQVADALARGAAALGGTYQDIAQRRAEDQRAMMASDAKVDNQRQLQDLALQWSRVPDATKARDGFVDDAMKVREATLARIQDPHVQAMVTQDFDEAMIRHGTEVEARAYPLEVSAKRGALKLQLNGLENDYAQAVTPQGRAQVMTTATTAIDTLRDAGYLPGAQAAEEAIGFRQRADWARAFGDINADPAAALKRLNDQAEYPNLDPLTRDRLVAKATAKAGGIDAALRGQVASAFNDNLVAIERTGAPAVPLSEAQIRAAFPDKADDMLARQALAGHLYRAVQSTALTSPQQDAAMTATWQPQGSGYAMQAGAQDALRQTLTAKYKRLAQDPAGYVLGAAPDIKGLFDQAAKDPQQLGPALGALDAAYDRLGVAPEERHVLPQAAAERLAADLMADPAQAPQKIQALTGAWGGAAPRVWRDLTSLGHLPANLQAVGALGSERDGALLARWLAEAPKGKTAADLLGAKAASDIGASVRSDPSVQAYLQSLSRSGASVGQADGVLAAIDALAFAKSYFERSAHPALDAIAAFTGAYDFSLPGGPRVPKDRAADVAANAAALLAGLDERTIAVPPLYGKPGMPAAPEYLDWVKSAPAWITAPAGDALWLMDPQGRLVRGPDGSPRAVPFAAGAPAAGAAAALPGAPAAGPAFP